MIKLTWFVFLPDVTAVASNFGQIIQYLSD